MEDRVTIDRFAVKNFRSIQECDVALEPLTFLVGTNGSGKTSFVDAMLFIASGLRTSLANAIAERGGIYSILHHPVTLPASSRFAFYLSSTMGIRWEFHLELRVLDGWSVSVAREECRIDDPSGAHHNYLVENGSVHGSAPVFPAVSIDRIFLTNASGLPEFRSIFDYLSGLASTQPTPPGREERGMADRFFRLTKSQPARLEIIQQYLRAIAPPFEEIAIVEADDTLWLRFVEKSRSGMSMPFHVSQASAGLVHAADILLELFELPSRGKPASPVVIEEPETLLHPGAIEVLRDSFIEASRVRQLLVTTHSPHLIDDLAIPAKSIRAVSKDEDGTHIDALDPGTDSVIRDRLYTAGQLLRQGGLILRS
jgi:predicted ATPase